MGTRDGREHYWDVHYRAALWSEPFKMRPYARRYEIPSLLFLRSENVRRLMAWLATYTQGHTWQLAEMLGVSHFQISRIVFPLFKAGLLERGRPSLEGVGACPYIYQINRDTPYKQWMADLTPAHWLGVTGGTAPTVTSYYRHNVQVGDLALMAARNLPYISLVLGEPFAAASRLIPGDRSGAIGDAVLVRRDGLRIVIEFTAATTERLGDKIQRWGRILSSVGTVHDHGTIIVLLNGAMAGVHAPVAKQLKAMIDQRLVPDGLVRGAGRISDSITQATRLSIVYADWHEWIKPGGVITPQFGYLRTWYSPWLGQPWQPLDLGTLPFQPADRLLWQAPMRQADQILSVPATLRNGRLYQRSGYICPIETPEIWSPRPQAKSQAS